MTYDDSFTQSNSILVKLFLWCFLSFSLFLSNIATETRQQEEYKPGRHQLYIRVSIYIIQLIFQYTNMY